MNMKRMITSLALVASMATMAQVSNGSFEVAGDPSLETWYASPGDAMASIMVSEAPGAPVECGEWSLRILPGVAHGLVASELTNVNEGDSISWSAWVYPLGYNELQGMGIGLKQGGPWGPAMNPWPSNNTLTTNTPFQWQQISGSMRIPSLNPQDTLVIWLFAGEVSSQVLFDGIDVAIVPEGGGFSEVESFTQYFFQFSEDVTAVGDAISERKPLAWPNPASDAINVQASDRPASAFAVLADGRTVKLQNQWSNGNCRLDVSQLPIGQATIRLIGPDGSTSAKAIIAR